MLGSHADIERQLEGQLSHQATGSVRAQAESMMALKAPVIATKKAESLKKHITAEAESNPTAVAQVVRTWLHG